MYGQVIFLTFFLGDTSIIVLLFNPKQNNGFSQAFTVGLILFVCVYVCYVCIPRFMWCTALECNLPQVGEPYISTLRQGCRSRLKLKDRIRNLK